MHNTAFLKGRTIMVVVMGLLYGAGGDGCDLATALFLALGQASQIATFLAAGELFYMPLPHVVVRA
ncbi:TPA: hypothetical protein N0F65_009956 [Lagenidium giganteum]|uniref:Uncharacterized protein n=1 Tax=Lagenidium giganteum TaxID=4803 RepID=A0AAV2YUL1_9STRA|nr:TPA: hypothetical protein N0F65_009956 [Lagenidium giganteum]